VSERELVTVTVSSSDPTRSSMVRSTLPATVIVSLKLLNPGSVTSRAYSPGGKPTNSKRPVRSLRTSYLARLTVFVSTSFVSGRMRLVASTMPPENVKKRCAPSPATRTVTDRSATAVAARIDEVGGRRSRFAFSMAVILP
jgi:hypothetical protein